MIKKWYNFNIRIAVSYPYTLINTTSIIVYNLVYNLNRTNVFYI